MSLRDHTSQTLGDFSAGVFVRVRGRVDRDPWIDPLGRAVDLNEEIRLV
jgi:hypothetical protein